MRIAGTPRSLAEMEFVAQLHPCASCGERRPAELRARQRGPALQLHGPCPRCSTERVFEFEVTPEVSQVKHGALELGGAEPSSLLAPHVLVAEIDRLVPSIVIEPERLDDHAWHTNLATVERVLTALNELAKFLPADGATIPPTAHLEPAGVADAQARPERYTATWIREERTRWTAVTDRIAADAPRIYAMDPMVSRATPPRGTLDKASLAAHQQWLARGQQGEGRLDVVTVVATGSRLDGADLSHSRLEGVLMTRADLRFATLDQAELVDVDLGEATLASASLIGTKLRSCKLDGASLGLAKLDRAEIEGSSFQSAGLERTQWIDAVVSDTNLRGARFGNTRFDAARFTGCDLRDASFALTGELPIATSHGTTFERCDFRGADFARRDLSGVTFVACRFAGAHGTPSATTGWIVTQPDFSPAGDGSDLGEASDLLDELTGSQLS